jgi:tetrapyrrole methylase family protein/MazG family protein
LGVTLNGSTSTPVDRIEELIAILRGDDGCPWDKKQTVVSMARYLIEEVYELTDALVAGDPDAVLEEAGDVLFQLLFVVHLFKESGHFDLGDVVDQNVKKMVRRHPHVFGDATADTPEAVRQNWDRIKQTEKAHDRRRSVFDTIPKRLPALLRAAMVSERAANTGFDWDDISGVMAKTMEEWAEFSSEIKRGATLPNGQKIAMEFGDLLFTMVNVARFARVDPETALMQSIHKFERRFGHMEEAAIAAGRDLAGLSIQEMHDLWEASKAQVG